MKWKIKRMVTVNSTTQQKRKARVCFASWFISAVYVEVLYVPIVKLKYVQHNIVILHTKFSSLINIMVITCEE